MKMNVITKANTEIASLENYRYIVERYVVSLKQLTVVAYPFVKDNKPIFITFQSVKYMQLLTYWEHVPFLLDSAKNCKRLMDELGLEHTDAYDLYYVQLETTRINIISGLVTVSDSMPNP